MKDNLSKEEILNKVKKMQLNRKKRFEKNSKNVALKHLIKKENEEIRIAEEATKILDTAKRNEYIYNYVFSVLDEIWKKNNPCKFCNDKCINHVENGGKLKRLDGCCYSFEYEHNFFKMDLLKNRQQCKYLGKDKMCKTQNLSCKLYTCDAIKSRNFKIKIRDFILLKCFFDTKQLLVLKHNFFFSKEEILDKLMEKNNMPLILYYYRWKYMIKF